MAVNWHKKSWLPWSVFTVLGAFIVYPWFLEPGFIFLLDFVWAPQLTQPLPPTQVGHLSSLPWQWLWWTLTKVFEISVVQKIAITLPFLLAGISMYHLVVWTLSQYTQKNQLLMTIAATGAGLFYLTNSFVFTRVVMGQHYLLLAYALTPWALLTWLKFIKQPSTKNALAAGLMSTLVMLTNAHHLILMPMLLLFFIRTPRRIHWQAWLVCLAPIFALLIATLLVQQVAPDGATSFNPLGPWARALQAPHTGNVLLDTFILTATWKVDLPFLFPYESLPGFTAAVIVLLAMMLVGAIYFWRQKTIASLIKRLLILIAISCFLTIGVSSWISETIAAWLYQYMPGWIGLRDSAKFLSLLALAEAILLGLGIFTAAWLTKRLPWRRASISIAIAALLLTSYTATPALAGFGKQIYPLSYPVSWYAWNNNLALMQSPSRTLFLPWHMYLPFTFTADRTVVNPAPNFFNQTNIISSENSKVGGTKSRPFIYSESERPLSQRLEAIMIDAPKRVDIGNRLAGEHIRYVMLATDTWDANEYHYLYQQPELKLVFEGLDLVVWENSAYRQ